MKSEEKITVEEEYIVRGGTPLRGEVKIRGAKKAALGI